MNKNNVRTLRLKGRTVNDSSTCDTRTVSIEGREGAKDSDSKSSCFCLATSSLLSLSSLFVILLNIFSPSMSRLVVLALCFYGNILQVEQSYPLELKMILRSLCFRVSLVSWIPHVPGHAPLLELMHSFSLLPHSTFRTTLQYKNYPPGTE